VERGSIVRTIDPANMDQEDLFPLTAGGLRLAQVHFESQVNRVFGTSAAEQFDSLTRAQRRTWIMFSLARPGEAARLIESMEKAGESLSEISSISDDRVGQSQPSLQIARRTAAQAEFVDEQTQ